jgi:hypothetical protein
LTLSISSCCHPIPSINSLHCGVELIILPYMDLKICDEPIDDINRQIALIFYVENPKTLEVDVIDV